MFKNEMANNAFKKFVKSSCIPSVKISFFASIRFDGIITNAVDALSHSTDVGGEVV